MTISTRSQKTTKRDVQLERVLRKARRNFTTYKRLIWRNYQHAPHLAALDNMLMACSRHAETMGRDGLSHVVVEMPPRHGKTTTISRLFPTWHMGRNPDHRVILASYGASLAHKNSRYARNLLMMARYHSVFPHVALDARSSAADAWDLSVGGTDYVSWQWNGGDLEFTRDSVEGGSDAMGVGGGVTGKGGHIIIVDDPVKSREQAESETYRNKVWDWFTDDLYTRREPGASVIVVMTRWHQDDLVGRLVREHGDRWHRLRMPALAEDENDALGREPGKALWPARYGLSALADIELTLGPYSWSALYQQRPTPAEGGIFKRAWFEPVVMTVPHIKRTVRYWDLAMSEKTSADYTVGVKLGQADDGHYYILDVVRRQIDWGDVVPFMMGVILRDGARVQQGVERKGYMSRAIKDLNADHRLHAFTIKGYSVDTDKLTRALPVAAKLAAGLVHMQVGHWNTTFIEEVCSFPNGAHDDQVDALSGAWEMMESVRPVDVSTSRWA